MRVSTSNQTLPLSYFALVFPTGIKADVRPLADRSPIIIICPTRCDTLVIQRSSPATLCHCFSFYPPPDFLFFYFFYFFLSPTFSDFPPFLPFFPHCDDQPFIDELAATRYLCVVVREWKNRYTRSFYIDDIFSNFSRRIIPDLPVVNWQEIKKKKKKRSYSYISQLYIRKKKILIIY